jgi:RNAse (barnase) inhibitor barstar
MKINKNGLTGILCLIGIITLGVIYYLFPTSDEKGIKVEIFKLLIQFFLVGILGVVISLIVQKYNRTRDKELLINELRKTTLNNLVGAYLDAKKCRRILRAKRLKGNKISYEIYDEQLKKLIDIELSLELLSHQINISKKLFDQEIEENILSKIKHLDNYLSKIVDEYKDALINDEKIPVEIDLEKFKKTKAWLLNSKKERLLNDDEIPPSQSKDSDSENNQPNDFVGIYKEVVEVMRTQISK